MVSVVSLGLSDLYLYTMTLETRHKVTGRPKLCCFFHRQSQTFAYFFCHQWFIIHIRELSQITFALRGG